MERGFDAYSNSPGIKNSMWRELRSGAHALSDLNSWHAATRFLHPLPHHLSLPILSANLDQIPSTQKKKETRSNSSHSSNSQKILLNQILSLPFCYLREHNKFLLSFKSNNRKHDSCDSVSVDFDPTFMVWFDLIVHCFICESGFKGSYHRLSFSILLMAFDSYFHSYWISFWVWLFYCHGFYIFHPLYDRLFSLSKGLCFIFP